MDNKPTIYKAKSLSVSVWNNTTNKGLQNEQTYKSFKIQRAYKNKETNKFEYTDNLREEDISTLSLLLQTVFEKEIVKRFD